MRIDVVDTALEALHRLLHAAHGAFSGGRDHVIAIRGRAVADQFSQNRRPTRLRVTE